ncbi:MAG: DMT family transporter [Oscillospiraceae bacterium]|nr:DMT family transporter [Oscillospiraceae bacterium]
MNRKRGYVCLVLAALIFSTTEVALKLQSGMFHPMQLTCERMFIAGFFLLPFALRHMKKTQMHLGGEDFIRFALLGFFNALSMATLQLAILQTDASAVAILYSGNPVFAVFLAGLLLHEKLRRNHLVALAFQLVGIVLILNPAQMEINLPGFLLALLSTLLYALYNTLCKRHADYYGSFVLTSCNLIVCAFELLLLLLLGRWAPGAAFYRAVGLDIMADVPFLSGFTFHSTLALLYVGIVVAGLGNFFTVQTAKDTSATEASFIYFFKPVFAAAVAATVLNEHISTHRAIGIVFFMLASACILLPLLRELRTHAAVQDK